ncbi:hypothetical protein UFOVP1186_12 [uncultured Caudovirales phage]|uniref:Uncharacterized protein n=1 Tax=uncultured Caudovirales phage TaxID=2100421 RepID=A0A6J5R6W8_9CAUD|nr:hypothetical protein UFOVP959_12 [uncultured Caudovirales phage]CAB4189291.1 hypothetical protein UFOVP1186_12 [uncultured Caudovirales phage]CAB4192178.1 hypothetical protein UFOVP1234_7 [uncultured Caudovirales phage]CAB4215485.1 hypothetical protein UFOVP1487_20 [uncultured Caudovirales phage]CAB5238942.1 hypothetical protein UFOVP1574_34 [uncultured Caudovirales phage]
MPNRVTAAQLIRALKGDGTLERVARKIDVPLRTVQRWAHMNDPETGPQWRYMSRLLADAGWITDGDQPVIDRLETHAAPPISTWLSASFPQVSHPSL